MMGTLQFLEPFNFPAPLRARIIATFTVPTERSGMLLTVMGTLEFLYLFKSPSLAIAAKHSTLFLVYTPLEEPN